MRGSVDSQRGLPCLAGDMVSVNVCIVHDVNFHAGLFCGLNMGLDIVSGIDHQCRCPATAAERRMRDRLDPDAKLTHDHGLHAISRRTRDAPAGCTRRRVGSCRAVCLEYDYEVRRPARRAKDSDQVRRLLAIAAVLDGASRADAAKVGGMERQTLEPSRTSASHTSAPGREPTNRIPMRSRHLEKTSTPAWRKSAAALRRTHL